MQAAAVPSAEASVIERATQIVMKNKSFRPRERGAGGKKGLKNLQTVKTLAGRTANVNVSSSGSTGGGKGRKQPLTVTAQFQHSLHSLMDTLNQANPFFIRCIKSNADKIPNKFDDETVQRQLRYTGMLETVRIRQAGYNVRLSYDEFIQLYRILLPRGLLSSQTDVREFLLTLNLNRDNYQTGGSKIFLRECEKLKLDYRLHQQIVASIVAIQRWFRALLQRRRFTRIRQATLILQSYWRMWAAQKFATHLRQMETAAVRVQSAWRAHHTRTLYRRLREATISFQAHCRGYLTRQRHANSNKMQQKQSKVRIQSESSTMDPDQDDQHYETMKRLKALSANDNETREIRLGDPNKEILGVDTKKKQRNVPKSLPDELSLINKVERKGSCDSLASQRSNDSQSNSAPVRDTLYRAKKQIQALMGIVKKDSTSPVSPVEAAGHTSHGLSDILSHCHSDASQCHSDSEMESNFEWMRHCTPATVIEYITPTVDHISSTSTSNSPTSPMTQKHPARRTKYHPTRRAREHLPSIPTTVINYITPTIDHISSSSNSPTSPMGPARRCESHEPTAPRRTARRVLVQADSDVTQLKHSSNQAPSSQDLKRRNSDPQPQQQSQPQAATAAANKRASQPQAQQPQSPLSPLDVDRKSITLVTIAGHQFRKVARFAKDDKCQYCSKAMDALLAEGHKCTDCKQLFHVKCIQNGGVVQLPCRGSAASVTSSVTSSVARRKQLRKRSATSSARTLHSGGSSLHGSSADSARALHASGADAARLRHAQFSLTGTSEFTDRTDKIISDVRELQKMQDFITEKVIK
ncbi:myosin-VIIa [Nilaparvata lugens]|uniref:myosin-VIIa n=1 Tax=Nilaparvata lugens TaxID=108931 RepID=UPI00193D444C|nr:myosin-VIIa [Nilaparvata lugens]